MIRMILVLLLACEGWQPVEPAPGAVECWIPRAAGSAGAVCRWPDPPSPPPTCPEPAPAPTEPAAWAVGACRRICRSFPPVVVPSARPEDGGWRCLCDHTAPEVLE